MDLNEYQLLAMRTAPEDTGGKHLDHITLQLLHAAMGISSEIGEILKAEEDIENLDEETGDGMWYVALGSFMCGVNLEDLDGRGFSDDPFKDLQIWASELMDLMKRHLFYGRPESITSEAYHEKFMDRYKQCLIHILISLKDINSNYGGRDFISILKANIAKLEARYPEKFTPEAALNRNLKQEMEAFRNA